MVRHIFALVGICVALLLSAPASATDIYYAVFQSGSSDPLYYWRLDQTATVPTSTDDGTSFTVNNVAGFSTYFPTQYDVTYYSGSDGGGFKLSDALTSSVLLDATGAPLYSGSESSPVLTPGVNGQVTQVGTGTQYTLATVYGFDALGLYPPDPSGPQPSGGGAHIYDFTITGDYTADWELIATSPFLVPQGDGHSWITVPYVAGDFSHAPGLPALDPGARVRFYDDFSDGGLTIYNAGSDDEFFDGTGDPLYDPTDPDAPFKTGSFTLTGIDQFAGKTATLTITEVLPVPEAPTWLMAIAGFALLGGALRHRTQMLAPALRLATI